MYYEHFAANCVQQVTGLYTENTAYFYPRDDLYLDVMNIGYMNKDAHTYSFDLEGEDVPTRLASTLVEEDLKDEGEGTYQDWYFTMPNFNVAFFESHAFTRISEKKYQSTEKAVMDIVYNICCPQHLRNNLFMTFSRCTVELDVDEDTPVRFRLYAESFQTGKLIRESLDQEAFPNWYLLFAEATVDQVGQVAFHPTDNL